jgi:methionyl-tRNA synthetase
VRVFAILVQPVMPDTAAKLLTFLGVAESQRAFAALGTRLVAGTPLPAPTGVFPRVERTAGT